MVSLLQRKSVYNLMHSGSRVACNFFKLLKREVVKSVLVIRKMIEENSNRDESMSV